MTRPATKAATIAAVNLRRFFRDRGNLFFSFVFPIAMILVIGLQFGGEGTARVGVVDAEGALAEALVDALTARDADIDVVEVDDAGSAADRVESSDLDAVLVFPEGFQDAVDAGSGAEVTIISGNSVQGQQMQSIAEGELARLLAGPIAEAAVIDLGVDPSAAAAAIDGLAPVLDQIEVRTVTSGDLLFPEGTEGFDVSAPSMVVLFVFVNGLAGSYALIQTRDLGVSSRMLSTPTSARSIIFGEGLGRWVIGIVQGAYIVIATLLLFGVRWGDALGAAAIVVAVAAVSAGAAMVFGTVFSNAEQASGIGVVFSLGLAALGGAMMPIELFSDTLASVARLTPHYWAIDAFAELIRHDGTILDIGTQLGVLAVYALVLMLAASWRMRQVLTRPR